MYSARRLILMRLSVVASPSHGVCQRDMSSQSVIALNITIFTTVLLASRLGSTDDAFAFLSFSFALFVFYPAFCADLQAYSATAFAGLTAATVAGVLLLLRPVSCTFTIIYAAAVLLVSLVCPLVLVQMQRFKDGIQGPWDIAHCAQLQKLD